MSKIRYLVYPFAVLKQTCQGPQDAHRATTFIRKPAKMTAGATKKMIGIQVNDLSAYNIFKRHGCHGRAERRIMLFEAFFIPR